MRIGLFGGSFNPIHNGHIVIGSTMLRAMHLDEVWYIVSPQNPLKVNSNDIAPEILRYDVVAEALADFPSLLACDYEFQLPRPSYTWDTLQQLHRDFPDHTFVLIIGGDNWACFSSWAHHEEIVASYEIAVFPREGMSVNTEALPENVHFIDVPLVNVTSTQLREMIRNGVEIASLVPAAVLKNADIISFYTQKCTK